MRRGSEADAPEGRATVRGESTLRPALPEKGRATTPNGIAQRFPSVLSHKNMLKTTHFSEGSYYAQRSSSD